MMIHELVQHEMVSVHRLWESSSSLGGVERHKSAPGGSDG